MAYGEEPAGGGPRYVIYIRPSRDLVAQSWYWPPAWHRAFERAAGQLGRAVAFCILQGLPLTIRSIAQQLPVDCMRFSVKCRETSVYIAVSEFTGPHTPGPDGGTRQQPCSVDGLVLGLRGSGKSFSLVVFQGRMPLPAEGVFATDRVNANRICRITKGTSKNWIRGDYLIALGPTTRGNAVEIKCDPRSNGRALVGNACREAGLIWTIGKDGQRGTASEPSVLASSESPSGWMDSAGQRLRKNLTTYGRPNPSSPLVLGLPFFGQVSSDHRFRFGKPSFDHADRPQLL